jgi:predicted esterase
MTAQTPTLRGVAAFVAMAAMLHLLPQPVAAQGAAAMRDNLAVGYLELELALADAGSADRRRQLNRDFDRLTLLFFAGNMQGALAVLDTLVLSVAGDQPGVRAALQNRARLRLAELNAGRRAETVAGAEVRYLIHVPPGPPPEAGWPVVVAVHGMGGDERMFFGGYGGGSIRPLADRHGMAVITPAAPLSTVALIGLVDNVAGRYSLDATRLALLGHSMGAGVVSHAAGEQPERVRAVACLAGSCAAAGPAGQAVPVFMAAGALDPLFRVDMLRQQAEALAGAGREVVFRSFDEEGHTLLVGEALPQVMEWLAQRLR